jgi:hypothetical protein
MIQLAQVRSGQVLAQLAHRLVRVQIPDLHRGVVQRSLVGRA